MPAIHEVATLTSKGQITLPKSIRQALGADTGRQAITHSAQTARGQMGRRPRELAVLGDPHLVLTDIAGGHEGGTCQFR